MPGFLALLLIAIILIVAIAIVVFLRRRRREAQEAAIVAASTPVPELSEDDIAWRIGVAGVDRPEGEAAAVALGRFGQHRRRSHDIDLILEPPFRLDIRRSLPGVLVDEQDRRHALVERRLEAREPHPEQCSDQRRRRQEPLVTPSGPKQAGTVLPTPIGWRRHDSYPHLTGLTASAGVRRLHSTKGIVSVGPALGVPQRQ
jgi:hypothetical protein